MIDNIFYNLQGLAWTVHLGYLATLKVRQIGSSVRGSKLVLVVWTASLITSALYTQSCYTNNHQHWTLLQTTVMRALDTTHLTLQVQTDLLSVASLPPHT